jgi:hypothetical protein
MTQRVEVAGLKTGIFVMIPTLANLDRNTSKIQGLQLL